MPNIFQRAWRALFGPKPGFDLFLGHYNSGHFLLANQAADAQYAGNFQEAARLWQEAADWIEKHPGEGGPFVLPPTIEEYLEWIRTQRECYLLYARSNRERAGEPTTTPER